MLSFTLFMLTVGIVHGMEDVEPISAIYDAAGVMGQCSEGPKSYIANCVFPSDFFTYITMEKPTIGADGVTCASMGYALLGTDPIFTGFKQHWKGATPEEAKANFGKWATTVFNVTGHPELMQYLNFTRDHNNACKMSVYDATASPKPLKSDVEVEDTPGAYYDPCGHVGQCADGKYTYLLNCVKPSDYFGYMNSGCPTVVNKKTCADLGYEKIMHDPIFDFDIFWKGGNTSFQNFFKLFAPGHPDNVKFITKARNDNPACGAR